MISQSNATVGIPAQQRVVIIGEGDLCRLVEPLTQFTVAMITIPAHQYHGRVYDVRAIVQAGTDSLHEEHTPLQHAERVVAIRRLLDDLIVDGDDRVAGEHQLCFVVDGSC